MLPEEELRALAFIAAVVAVYAIAAWFALRAVIQRRWARRPFPGERRARRFVFVLCGLGVGCAAYGRFVEPFWLEVVHVQVESPRWHGNPLRSSPVTVSAKFGSIAVR